MPIHAGLDPATIVNILARRRAGEVVKVIAADLGVAEHTVVAYTCHLFDARSPVKEARRAAILACLEAGLDVSTAAAKVPCTIATVVRIIRARRAEEDAVRTVLIETSTRMLAPTPEQISAAKEQRRLATNERRREKRRAEGAAKAAAASYSPS